MAEDASKFVLPASPNWYCSTVADCSLSKIYAFGARNCVYLLDVSSTTPVFAGQLIGHADRVTSVSFSKYKLQTSFIASGSDDKTVKIWDLETKLALLEHKAHNAKVTCLTWSPLVTDLVISGDEKGQIVAWRYTEELLFSSCHIQEHIFSIALSYLSENELAVGYKSGLIAVLNVNANDGRISMVNKLQGHSSEIHSLAWCPTPKDHIEFGPLQDKTAAAEGHLIVSGSRDQTVRLWDAFHGKILSVKQLPKRSSRKDKYDSYGPRDRLWLSVCWPVASPSHFISSTQGGELLLWDFRKEGKDQYKTFSMGHSRIVFNISCDVAGTRIMTVSMDRQIIIWDPQHLRSLHALPTLGGFAYSLAISPLDPGTLGIGVGDNMLRVWQTASSVGPYEALVLWQGIKSKVMVVKWHPNKEGLIAFGTDDGQVGVYNIISKRAESSSTYHKRTVYSLSWGPSCPKEGDSSILNVYSCAGDGSVLQHRTGHFMDDAVDVNALILKTNDLKHKPFGRADVSWNPDGSVLALGNEDGSIEVYVPPDLLQFGIIITHKKSITTLVWHHGYGEVTTEANTADSGSCKYWLASGSNESTIHVHDLGSMLGDSSSSSSRSAPITESFRSLAGHSGRVTDLSWSPHQFELLLSSSYDGTAQVWDVVKGEALFNFRDHSGRVMCVVWSYLDPDLVYSGGEDGTVRPWRPSLQQHRQPPVSEKKLSHSSGRSSKNKKSKQKGKGKADSAEKESWRQETVSRLEQSAVGEQPAIETPSDHSNEAESTSLVQSTELKQVTDAVINQEEQIVKPQDAITEDKLAPIEPDKRDECDSGMEPKAEVTSENDANHADTRGASEKSKSDVVFRQEPVVPLRSRVTLETSSSSKKKKKVKSMFPLSAVADSKSKTVTREECIELAKMIYGQKHDTKSSVNLSSHGAAESEGLVNLGLFADRRSAYRMFAAEGQHHKESGNLDYKLQLEIWKGNLGGALEMAASSTQLTEWLVSLSPLAGRDVWLATTRAFADQLESQGQHQRAVLYYLACHDIYKAIDVFKKQAMFREAIALAKVRLSPLDPVLFDLYSTWARKLETDNSFEQAAKCYLAVHSSADAVRVLCRRGDQPSLRTALQVATICGEPELASSLALRLTHSYLVAANWQGCHEILKDFAGVEAHMLNVCVHELLLVTLIQQQAIDQHECGDGARTEISSFLNSHTNTNQPWEKYSYLEVTSNSPWMANTNSRKWFVVCVLEAWYHSGAFKHDLVATLYETLKSYYETISTGTETTLEILFRISLEITLGLLSTLRSDLYSACQYWLQALSHCSKHCLFVLQRELCCILLPHGTQSLENLLGLSHDLCSVNSSDESKEKKSVAQLFLHFHAFYYKALMFEIWYRCPNILRIFQLHQYVSVEVKEESETSGSNCERLTYLEDSPITEPNKFQNALAISDYSGDKVGKEIPEAGEDLVAVDEDSRSKVNTKKPFSSAKNNFIVKQDLKSTLEKARKVLLSDHHAKVSNLRDLLTEIRKAMLLKRSKQFFQMNSAGSKLNQKKKKAKAQPAHAVQPLGFSPSSSERDPTSQNSLSEPVDGTQTESRENKGAALTGHSGSQVEVAGMNAKDIVGNEGEKQGEISTDQATLGGLSDELETVPATETDTKELATLDGKRPIDLRYVASDTSLESLTEEEERVLREIEQLEFKNLPFPSPLESALTMGNLCARPDGLPLRAPDLRTLGMNVLFWARRNAQTSTDLKGVKTLNRIYGSRKEV